MKPINSSNETDSSDQISKSNAIAIHADEKHELFFSTHLLSLRSLPSSPPRLRGSEQIPPADDAAISSLSAGRVFSGNSNDKKISACESLSAYGTYGAKAEYGMPAFGRNMETYYYNPVRRDAPQIKTDRIHHRNLNVVAIRNRKNAEAILNDPDRPKAHINGEQWMSDPCGIVFHNDYYHVFFQANTNQSTFFGSDDDPSVQNMYWGHMKTKDFTNWEPCPPAMVPSTEFDMDGIFTGCVFPTKDGLKAIYTANIFRNRAKDDVDQLVCAAYSKDGGTTWTKNIQPIIKRPPGFSSHFRDPAYFKFKGDEYLVIAAATENRMADLIPSIELYKADPKENDETQKWKHCGPLIRSTRESPEKHFGYMWECPNMVDLKNGKWMLVFSPQGVPRDGIDFQNRFTIVAMIGTFDGKKFTPIDNDLRKMQELDHGSDCYAAAVAVEPKTGRIILQMWHSIHECEDYSESYTGFHAFPREIVIEDDNVRVVPLKEMEKLRAQAAEPGNFELSGVHSVKLPNEVAPYENTELLVNFKFDPKDTINQEFGIKLWCSPEDKESKEELVIGFNTETRLLTMDRTNSGKPIIQITAANFPPGKIESNIRQCKVDLDKEGELNLHLYIDRPSLEIYTGKGIAMTVRAYPDLDSTGIKLFSNGNGKIKADVQAYRLKDVNKDFLNKVIFEK